MALECPVCLRIFHNNPSHCPYDGTPLENYSVDDEQHYIGHTLDEKYCIEQKIGSGGTCVVFRAFDLVNEKPSAVKILRSNLIDDIAAVKRFRKEVEAAKLIKHPNIVDIYDFGETPMGAIYIVMELLEGITLKQFLQTQGPFGLTRMNSMVSQICGALEAAHSKGLIHRDLKPDNIMLIKLANEEKPSLVKVLDFGIAKFHGDSRTTGELMQRKDIVMGTPRYMSPEQCSGHPLDARSDIYSLGLIVYEMLAGVPPFTDSSAQVLMSRHMKEPLPSIKKYRPGLPPLVEKVLLRALEKSPLKRFQTAKEFAQEMDIAVNNSTLSPAETSRTEEQRPTESKPHLVPVVKQHGSVSIVKYKTELDEKIEPKTFPSLPSISKLSSEEIKDHFKKLWSYWFIGLAVAALIIIALLIVILLFSDPHR
ncbi:MAG: serine/threonine protein kinase [Blastocatellia bacterium]|nr:serine/threonine protein kinase [Blastocatellia bacterium]